MPYYCTVPRCTSMAGKAKNVSFHQFPRDEELAKLWNKILKRGKPYTKYSKVCSLHFKPEDYTITSVGKNKGQWRTLRKDAIPSQNLPSDSPPPVARTRASGAWLPSLAPNIMDPRMQQQMAHAIYVQTMLAMHAAGTTEQANKNVNNESRPSTPSQETPQTSERVDQPPETNDTERTSYKCSECLKCFKDPDVFVLHSRLHTRAREKTDDSSGSEKENKQERSNPILANLLKTSVSNIFDANILSIENHIMTALAVNMESYLRNIMLNTENENSKESNENCDKTNESNDSIDSNSLVIDDTA